MECDWPSLSLEQAFSGVFFQPKPQNSLENILSTIINDDNRNNDNENLSLPVQLREALPIREYGKYSAETVVAESDDVVAKKSARKKQKSARKVNDASTGSHINPEDVVVEPQKLLSFDNVVMDVRKFTISETKGDEKQEAKVNLALKLGAKKPKNKKLPYDQLKEERQKEKEAAKQQRLERKYDRLKKTKSGKIKKKLKKRISKKKKTQAD